MLKTGLLTLFLCVFSPLVASTAKERVHYSSISSESLKECVSFCQLYPRSSYRKDIEKKLQLLLGSDKAIEVAEVDKLITWMGRLQQFFSGLGKEDLPLFSPEEEEVLLPLFPSFPNRNLAGYGVYCAESFCTITEGNVDLGSAFSADFTAEKQKTLNIVLDFLAAQAKEKFKENATVQEKVDAINELLFFDLGYRYAPMSDYEKNIDQYSNLSSVISSRRGVCMGTSLLFGAVAQRSGLVVEFVVPPGHIFPRVKKEDGTFINVETTARGIHIPLDDYKSVANDPIEFYTPKEAIGLLHYNIGSKFLSDKNPETARKHFQKALSWVPNQHMALEALCLSLHLEGKRPEAAQVYQIIQMQKNGNTTSFQEILLEEIMEESIDPEVVYLLYATEAKTPEEKYALYQKVESLQRQFPKCTSLHYFVAMHALSTNHYRQAIYALQTYVDHNPNDPQALHLLARFEVERFDYHKAKETWNKLALCAPAHCKEAVEELKWQIDTLSPFCIKKIVE